MEKRNPSMKWPKISFHPSILLWLFILFSHERMMFLGAISSFAIHELGHLLVAYINHQQVRSIKFTCFGGVIDLCKNRISVKQEIAIDFARRRL
jgi:hypothetical protein